MEFVTIDGDVLRNAPIRVEDLLDVLRHKKGDKSPRPEKICRRSLGS